MDIFELRERAQQEDLRNRTIPASANELTVEEATRNAYYEARDSYVRAWWAYKECLFGSDPE